MIPAAFEYRRAASVEDAVHQLAELGESARVIAGGQSLIPLMRLRFASPETLVDIARLRELSYVRLDGDRLRVGALTRHRELETSPVAREHLPLLAFMASQVGDGQVRNRGTLGGALAHADPAAEYAALCLALDAQIITTSRTIPADEFFRGWFVTSLAPGELITEVAFPVARGGHAYLKFGKDLFGWPILGALAQATDDGVRIGLLNVVETPIRPVAAEQALASGATPAQAADAATAGLSPVPAPRASAAYKLQLVRVLIERAVSHALA
jgi:carbon-monoxide dehydrogenase medium subunit